MEARYWRAQPTRERKGEETSCRARRRSSVVNGSVCWAPRGAPPRAQLPDLQCAWLLLAVCASPWANHALRTVPPHTVTAHARAHDAAIWDTLQHCLGGVGGIAEADAEVARHVATLPAALGGLGLTSGCVAPPARAFPALRRHVCAFTHRRWGARTKPPKRGRGA